VRGRDRHWNGGLHYLSGLGDELGGKGGLLRPIADLLARLDLLTMLLAKEGGRTEQPPEVEPLTLRSSSSQHDCKRKVL
jgi:hypothetical protein